MILKSLKSLQALGFSKQRLNFCTHSSPSNLRNPNLKFDTPEWIVNMYPFYPQIFKKKDKGHYEVSSSSIILTLIFINKTLEETTAWEQRRTFSFKFKDLKLFMNVSPLSGAEAIIDTGKINSTKYERNKILKVTDHPQLSKVVFNIKQTSIENVAQTSQTPQQFHQLNQMPQTNQRQQGRERLLTLETPMHYTEYRTLYKILQGSLLDLSGCRLAMQFQKKQQFSKLEGKASQDKLMDELFKN